MKLFSYSGKLKPSAPFDFSKSLEFLSDFMPTKSEQMVANGSLTKAVEIKGNTIAFRITDEGTIEKPGLCFTAYSQSEFNKENERAVDDRISFYLSLQDDLKEFYQIAQQDKAFKPVIQKLYGHKQVKFLTPFENACWAILGQRLPLTVSHSMKEKIVQKFGGHINVDGIDYYSFPDPTSLPSECEKLLEIIHNDRKAEYLAATVKAFSSVDEKWLRNAPFDEVYSWLTEIKGIGPWSAHFVLIRGLGRMERISTVDGELALAVAEIYKGDKEPLSEKEVINIAEKYGKWQGYWAYYCRIYA